MGRYTIETNTSLEVNLSTDVLDNGWSVSGGAAVHESCNQGFIVNSSFDSEPSETYKIQYTVSGWSSGGVRVIVGGTEGNLVNQNGTFTDIITASDASGLQFWSDGDLMVSGLRVSSGTVDGVTLSFNTENMKWVGYKSFVPEFMATLLDGFYSFLDGSIWKHNVNETRNIFYGQQYPSIIEFYVNVNPTMVKTFYSIREVGTHVWEIKEIYVRPRAGKSAGQRSRIKRNRFNRLQGQFFADILRDMDDPRFNDEGTALFKGAVLQGEVAKITMEINETNEVRLVSVDVLGSMSEYSY